MDFVLCFPKPALLYIVQYNFHLCFRTDYEGTVADGHGERSSDYSSKISSWVRELVFFVVSALKVDEYSQIVVPRCHFYACSRELGAELVEATRADTFDWTIDPPGGDRRMVGGLLGKI